MSSTFSITDLATAHDSADGISLLSQHVMNGKTYELVKVATGITVAAANEALYDSTTIGEVTNVPTKNGFRGVTQCAAAAGQFIWVVVRGRSITIDKVGATTVGGQVLASTSSLAVVWTAIESIALAGRLLGHWETVTSAGVGSAPATLY